MVLTAFSDGRFLLGERWVRCALGRGGVVPGSAKVEGDGASPLGAFRLEAVFFRPDREAPPATGLPVRALQPEDGWSDAPEDPRSNRLVTHPHPYSAERLWREDGIYDLLVVLGHNTDPPNAGAGSAIFLHLAREEFTPTQGCVALARSDLLELLRGAAPGDRLEIKGM